jgi:hypothetical protein
MFLLAVCNFLSGLLLLLADDVGKREKRKMKNYVYLLNIK